MHPVLIQFPEIADEDLLGGWTPLDSNVIGEVQWRIIFAEHEMADRAASIAAGWDGDRYAVLERDDDLLLLLYTTWDSEQEASEFSEAAC